MRNQVSNASVLFLCVSSLICLNFFVGANLLVRFNSVGRCAFEMRHKIWGQIATNKPIYSNNWNLKKKTFKNITWVDEVVCEWN